jgi:hypothetical protein
MATNKLADEALIVHFRIPMNIETSLGGKNSDNRENILRQVGEHRAMCVEAIVRHTHSLRQNKENESYLLKKISSNNELLFAYKEEVKKYRCLSGGNPTGISMYNPFKDELIDALDNVTKHETISDSLNLELNSVKAQIHMFTIANAAVNQSLAENDKYLESFENLETATSN